MASKKLFERNVRPRRLDIEDDVEEGLAESASDDELESEVDEDLAEVETGEANGQDDADENEDGDRQQDGDRVNDYLSTVSFGALKEAHDALSRKRKHGADSNAEQEDKLEALRERLRQIKHEKSQSSSRRTDKSWSATGPAHHGVDGESSDANSDDDDADDSDAAPSEEGAPARARTSKHAPMEQTSRRQVTRRRQVVDVPKRTGRDPRFDALQYEPHSAGRYEQHGDKAYAFLQEYQKAEMEELQAALKRTRSEDDRTTLRRKLVSMQNTLKTKAGKEREQEVVRRHRQAERERVQQGKTPYFLKRKEIKERALVEKFKGMKSKEREKLVEKRRLKESQREKRRMPEMRRRVS